MTARAASGAVRRVLVVDDSRAMLAIIRRVLEQRGDRATVIETVTTGEQALDAIERHTPALVVSDWHMPGISGIELLQTLRQMGHSDLPVGFVTTETTPALLQQATTNGAAFIVHKPFKDKDLLAAVARVLGPPLSATGATPEEAPAAASPINGVRALRRYIQAWMPGVPFRVMDGEPFHSQHLTVQNLLTVYQPSGGGGICALAAANLPALCMLGGSAIQAETKDIRRAIHDGVISEAMLESATRFFREFAMHLGGQIGVDDAVFKGANAVPRDFGKLRSAVDGTGVRADYRLSVPGFGDGRLTFLRA